MNDPATSTDHPFSDNSIDYAAMSAQIKNRLDDLQNEKNKITAVIKDAERRFSEVEVMEEKLQNVYRSLGELLAAAETQLQPASRLITSCPPAVAGETALAPQQMIDRPASEIDRQAIARQAVDDQTATAAAVEPQIEPPIEPRIEPPIEIPAEENLNNTAADNDEIADKIALEKTIQEFDKRDFFARYPHIQTTHPVHLLARHLLEYYERGLTIGDLARLIERLGYRHQSSNFTDSVHSALKSKRQSTGEFRFNKQLRVWELSHWQDKKEQAVNQELPQEAPERRKSSAATLNLTREVENAIGKKLEKAEHAISYDQPVELKQSRRRRNSRVVKKAADKNGITIYKREV